MNAFEVPFMFIMRRIVQFACLTALLQAWGCMAATPRPGASSSGPDDAMIGAFAGDVSMVFPGDDSPSAVLVSDRILDGLQAGPGRLVAADGTVIYWGFKFQEGNLQSVVIRDSKGRPRLLAVVNNVVRVADGDTTTIGTVEQYQAELRSTGGGYLPGVSVFVRNANDLATYLPYLKSWLQADLLGFNATCDKAAMTAACTLAARIVIPIRAYALVPKQAAPHALPVPVVAKANIPLESFVQ